VTETTPPARRRWPVWLAPALAVVLLTGMAVGNSFKPSPGDAEPFHKAVRDAADAMPDHVGKWKATSEPADEAAVQLLRPNVLAKRRFTADDERVYPTFMVVQTRDARDLVGHYPPICYRSHGWRQMAARPVTWEAGGKTFPGREYVYAMDRPEGEVRTAVANFFILPDGRVLADHEEVRQLASDYTRRHFGAAQIWVVVNPDRAGEQRRHEIVVQLLEGHMGVLTALGSATFDDQQGADGSTPAAETPADPTDSKD